MTLPLPLRAFLVAVPWIPLLVGGLFVATTLHQCSARVDAEAVLAREREANVLIAQNQIVIQEVKQRVFSAALKAAYARAAGLEERVKALQAQHPGAKPVVVISASTGPISTPTPPAGSEGACRFRDGDAGQIDVTIVGSETKAGNTVIHGVASCLTLHADGSPPTKVVEGPFDAKLTQVTTLEKPLPPPNKWSAGLLVGVAVDGAAAGALTITTPSVTIPFVGIGASLEAVGVVDSRGRATILAGPRFTF